jgi:hypothetical protein
MHRGTGTIQRFNIESTIATLHLRVHGGETLVLHGHARFTLEALANIFQPAPAPAAPTALVGKRIRYKRDGNVLMSIGEV